tara:strand:- start:129 stop:629 length:501 start_codon:yes stop_codon:yes gene_type:complete
LSYGWKDSKKIVNHLEIWRLLTPTFLHGNAYHIIANVVSQLFLGNGIEYGLGMKRFIGLYSLTGFGGMLLSSIMKPESFAIGASTSVFGLVGFYISYLFTNWSFMGRERPGQRGYLFIFTFLICLVNLNIGPMANGNVDNYGHYGGLITGLLLGLALAENYDREAR